MTLKQMLLDAGLTPLEASRIHRHILNISGDQRQRSTPALVLDGKEFQLMTLVRSRVEGEEHQVFTIKNITL